MVDQHSSKHILPDHYEEFSATFDHLQELIDQGLLQDAKEILTKLHPADLADFFDNAPARTYRKIFPVIEDSLKPETLIWISNSGRLTFANILGIERTANLIEQLDIEDAFEIIETFDDELREEVISKLTPEKQLHIREGFTYPENAVGRVMEKKFIPFLEHWTVGQAIDSIRRQQSQRDFHAAIVVDNKYRPVGIILLSTLLKYQRNRLIRELMTSDFKVADTNTDLGELAYTFKQYALTIVPVVNKSGRLVGSVSVDNMIYIIEQQAEEEIMHLGGINTQDTFLNLFNTVKHRFPWLFINLITACITAIVINHFSDTIATIVTLAAIMPIVASMGGNAGTQAMTVTVRALSNKDITKANTIKVVIKEILVCGFNGVLLALIGASLMLIMFADIELSMIFAAAVIINFLVAGFFGSAIPITLHNLDIDPAAASGVCLTALTDSFGFFTFLTLAYVFLT